MIDCDRFEPHLDNHLDHIYDVQDSANWRGFVAETYQCLTGGPLASPYLAPPL